MRFAAGAATTRTLVHDRWEEVYMLSGELRPLRRPTRALPTSPIRAARPGRRTGLSLSGSGYVLLEMQYNDLL